ncbi:hypothetical protein SLS56_009916 [Neofusicoccum ribis]|uniref:Uncharacterized protein n=1 Tax=Neofusicoccum ribis TaxID=45134 RepID=A0ABR3SG12_9PEZI
MPPLRPIGSHALRLPQPLSDSDEDPRYHGGDNRFKSNLGGHGSFTSRGENRPPRIPKHEQDDDALAYEKQKRKDNPRLQQLTRHALAPSSQPRTCASGSLVHASERVGPNPQSAYSRDEKTRTSETRARPTTGDNIMVSAEARKKFDAPQHSSAIPRTAPQPGTRAHEPEEEKQITALTQADLRKTVANLEAELENQNQRRGLLNESVEVLRQQLVLRDRQRRGLEETITELRESLLYFKSNAQSSEEEATSLESQIKDHHTLSREFQLREDGLKEQISYMEKKNQRAERERESYRRSTDNLIEKQALYIAELEELLDSWKSNNTASITGEQKNHQSSPDVAIFNETPQNLVCRRILSEAVFMPDKDDTEHVLSVLPLRATTVDFLVEALSAIVDTADASRRAEQWMAGSHYSEGYCLNGALKRHQRSTYNKGSNCTTSGRLCISRDAYSGKLLMRKSQNAKSSHGGQDYWIAPPVKKRKHSE